MPTFESCPILVFETISYYVILPVYNIMTIILIAMVSLNTVACLIRSSFFAISHTKSYHASITLKTLHSLKFSKIKGRIVRMGLEIVSL